MKKIIELGSVVQETKAINNTAMFYDGGSTLRCTSANTGVFC